MNDLAREIVDLSTPPDRPSKFALCVTARARLDFRNEIIDYGDAMIVEAPIEQGQSVFHMISFEPNYTCKYNAISNLDGAAACLCGFLTKIDGDYIKLVGASEDIVDYLRIEPPICEWNINFDRRGDPEAMIKVLQMIKLTLKTLLVM